MTDLVHGALYLLPGAALIALALLLLRAGREAAADAGSPRWARSYARAATAILIASGGALLLVGGALAGILWRG